MLTRSRAALSAAILTIPLLVPALALAQEASDQVPDPFRLQLWSLLAGALVPLVAYVLNYVAPWTSEKVKTFVFGVAATIAGALVELVQLGSVGFDEQTLRFVLSAVISALFAHGLLWKPSTVAVSLGGGRNKSDSAPAPPPA